MLANRNGGGMCAAVAACVMSCINRLYEIFNQFSLSMIALYGLSFTEASSAAWENLQRSCFAGVINELILERVVALCTIVVVIVSAIATYFIFDSFFALMGGLLVAVAMCGVVFTVISAAVTTYMVCVSDRPDVMQQNEPRNWVRLQEAINGMSRGCGGDDDANFA
jgi:hypothetical protein